MKNTAEIFSIAKYKLARKGIDLLASMPYPVALGMGRFAGFLGWIFDPFHRRIAAEQMKATIPEAYHWWTPLKSFMNNGDILIDTIRVSAMSDEELKSWVRIEGQEHLDQALATGRGIMLISGHIGNWEILVHLPRLIGFHYGVMADRRKDERLESIVQEVRATGGADVLPPKGGMVKRLVAELKAGRHIVFMVDQRGNRGNRLFCRHFGLPAPTNPAPAYIALRGDALVMPVYCIKEGDGFVLRFEPFIEARAFGDDLAPETKLRHSYRSQAVQRLSDWMQDWVEQTVRKRPDQWFWLHCRWTRRADMRRLLKAGDDFSSYVETQAEKMLNDSDS